MKQNIYSVSQVNAYVSRMFEEDFLLKKILIQGEVSNCKYHSSGHIYFTLKDEKAAIPAVMFAGNRRQGLKFSMKNGDQVIVAGSVEVYERDGKYQIYARQITLDGAGDLYLEFERIKAKLEEMGMFAPEYKKPIPRYATRVGIVTSPTGAAVRDIIQIARRRNPYVELILYPALVQGEGAVASVISGIRALDAMGLEVLIVGRGGGSIEELWAFNEEEVAREIFACDTPVISAVGHETDFTIADFVADLRAATPSEAAERAVFDFQQFLLDLDTTAARIKSTMVYRVRDAKRREEHLRQQMRAYSPANRINEKLNRCGVLEQRLADRMEAAIKDKKNQLGLLAGRLEGVSPAKKLSQGYACVTDEKGKRVSDGGDLQAGDLLRIYFRKGGVKAEVKEKIEGLIYGREE